jgi:hypothetical protein
MLAPNHCDQAMRGHLIGRHGPPHDLPPEGARKSMTTPASATTELEDRLAIIELIGRLSLTIDAKQWDAMAELFSTVGSAATTGEGEMDHSSCSFCTSNSRCGSKSDTVGQ